MFPLQKTDIETFVAGLLELGKISKCAEKWVMKSLFSSVIEIQIKIWNLSPFNVW